MSDPAPPNPQNRTSLSVSTGGGPFVAGNVHTGGGNFVAGDQIAVAINNIVQGINDLPTRYDGVVRNFLEYYLGSTAQPAPFGGRDDALAMLDHWLADPQVPPYALLAAPAGRGKSALLAHWVSRLAQRDDVHVVYFPISIRFSSNRDSVVFAALAARIAHVYGEKMTRANDAQEYRGVFVDYLRRTPLDGKPLLVVLDGLDEAAGWEAGADLFPLIPPGHLRVVVAARVLANDPHRQGWLAQLGWEKPGAAQALALAGLDRKGVADVLEKMGNPLDQLATQIDVVTQLHILSEGDPLLVRLYVEAMLPYGNQAATLRPENLLTLEPGLKAYFDQWFKGQEALWKSAGATFDRRGVNTLIDLCAVALGPLSKEDVLALAPARFEDSHSLESVVTALNRFIIGDGSLIQGYIFNHPRLRNYFADRLTIKERKQWEDRFLQYGLEILVSLENGALKPNKTSPYAVRYYGAHLSAANAPANNFFAMMCDGWLHAWEWVEGTPDGFLSDVRRAWEVAENESTLALGQMVRAALCLSSVVSISANIDANLLVQCVNAGAVSPQLALVMVRVKPDPKERAECLLKLSVHVPLENMLLILGEALVTVRAVRDEEQRVQVLLTIMGRIPPEAHGLLGEALVTVRAVRNEEQRVQALLTVVERIPPEAHGSLGEALDIVRVVRDERQRVQALLRVMERIPPEAHGLLGEALAIVRAVTDEEQRVQALLRVMGRIPPEAHGSLGEALAIVRVVRDEEQRVQALLTVARRLPLGQQQAVLAEALAIVRAVRGERQRVQVLLRVMERIPPEAHGLLGEALAIVRAVRNEEQRVQALLTVVEKLPLGQQQAVLAEALATVRAVSNETQRVEALLRVMECIPSEAHALFEEVLAIVCTVSNSWFNNESLPSKEEQLSLEHLSAELEKASATLGVASDERLHSQAWLNVAKQLTPGQKAAFLSFADPQWGLLLDDGAKISGIRWDPLNRFTVLGAIAQRLPAEFRSAMLDKILVVARSTSSEKSRVATLRTMANELPPEFQQRVLYEALAAARSINDERLRTETLSLTAQQLSPIHWREIMGGAFAIVRSIGDEGFCAEMLQTVVRQLRPEEGRLFKEALAIAHSISDEGFRVEMLNAVTQQLPSVAHTLLGEVLIAIRTVNNQGIRAKALSTLVQKIPPEADTLFGEVLAAIGLVSDAGFRTEILLMAVKHSPPQYRQKMLREVLVAARSINDAGFRAEALLAVAEQLPPERRRILLKEALTATRSISDAGFRAEALLAIAQQLPPERRAQVIAEVLAVVHSIWNERLRLEALHVVVQNFIPEVTTLLGEVVAVARSICNKNLRIQALLAVARQAPLAYRQRLLDEVFAVVRSIWDEALCANALISIVQQLPPDMDVLLEKALTIALSINDDGLRAKLLHTLAPRLSPEHRWSVLNEALMTALSIKEEDVRVDVLSSLSQHFPLEYRQAVLSAGLEIALLISEDGLRVEALNVIVKGLPSEATKLQMKLLRNISGIVHQKGSQAILAALVPYWQNICQNSDLAEVGEVSRVLHSFAGTNRENLLGAIQALMPVIARLGGERAVLETAQAIIDTGKWWP